MLFWNIKVIKVSLWLLMSVNYDNEDVIKDVINIY